MSVVFTLMFGLVLLIVMTQYFSEQYQKRFIAEQTTINVTTGQMIDSSLAHRRDALVQFTKLLISGNQLKSKDQLQVILDERIVLHHMFNGGLLVMNAQAEGLVDSPILPGRAGTDYSDRPHVQWVSQHLKPLITNPFLGRRMQAPIFIVNSPILSEQNQLLGYMIGIISLKHDPLLNQVHDHFRARHDRSFIIDPTQKLFVSSTDSQFLFQPIEDWLDSSLIDALMQQKSSGFAFNMNGEPIFYNAHRLETVDWILVSIRDESLISATVSRVVNNLLLIGLLMFLIGLPLLYGLLKSQLSPLRRAAEYLKKQPDQPINLTQLSNYPDEVNQLIQAFNQAIYYQQAHQQKLEQARVEAERANQTKSRFLAVMSHEVRNPLAAIMGLAEIGVAVDSDAAKKQDCLRKIYLTGEGLKGLLDDVLDLSKIEENKLVIQPVPFALSGLVEQIESQFLSLAQQKGLKFKVKMDDDLSAVYSGDRQRLLQVLNNLLSNALKFTEKGSVTVSIHRLVNTMAQTVLPSRQASEHGVCQVSEWVAFSVRDTGIGMSEEQKQKLFQPFQQGDDSISQFYGGTGLGLAISQDLVQLMGGDQIGLESTQHEGSHFFFSIPLGVCTADQVQQALSHVKLEKAYGCYNATLLLVEDVEINRRVLADILTSAGFDCYLAENGQEAIDIVNQQTIDLVLMDKQMPVMNGFDATIELRRFYPDLPIIGISADASDHDRYMALNVGMNVFLPKPVNSRVLVATICKLLETHEQSIDSTLEVPVVSEESLILDFEIGKPWLDLAEAMRFFDHKPRLLRKTLAEFSQQIAFEQFERLYRQVDAEKDDLMISSERLYKNWQKLSKIIHQLRGSCGLVGATILFELLTLLEDDVRHFQLSNADYLDQWQHSLKQTLAAIDQVLET